MRSAPDAAKLVLREQLVQLGRALLQPSRGRAQLIEMATWSGATTHYRERRKRCEQPSKVQTARNPPSEARRAGGVRSE